ncbi:hypothetical protein QBC37DRAFT_109984 [Rhypophila decipiens]|uniref:Uncharacterized protein n=1 Tax=Rhypophila decipiens TaxID=261697 RepID=A0AAN7BD74_9PEZI|nr:hypothetical protein QBC37DRAFT_109984 [Rhypophila decipiens]
MNTAHSVEAVMEMAFFCCFYSWAVRMVPGAASWIFCYCYTPSPPRIHLGCDPYGGCPQGGETEVSLQHYILMAGPGILSFFDSLTKYLPAFLVFFILQRAQICMDCYRIALKI